MGPWANNGNGSVVRGPSPRRRAVGRKEFQRNRLLAGGHLATAFNILRREEDQAGLGQNPVIATYTFNGAGVGDLKPQKTLTEVIRNFKTYLDDPDIKNGAVWKSLSPFEQIKLSSEANRRSQAIAAEQARLQSLTGVTYALEASGSPLGIQASVQYQLAALLAARDTVASSLFFDADVNTIPTLPKFADSFGRGSFANMTEVVGSDSGNLGPFVGVEQWNSLRNAEPNLYRGSAAYPAGGTSSR